MQCVQGQAGAGWRTDQKIIRTSRSAEDLLHHAEKSKDRVTARRSLILTSHPPHNQAGQERRKSLIFPEYSQVFDMEEQGNLDSLALDSGISSTSNSTSSYSLKSKNSSKIEEVEDLSQATWFQAEIQR